MMNLDALSRKYDIAQWRAIIHHNGQLLAPADTPGDMAAVIGELRAARRVVEAVPTVEHLRTLVKWLDLVDLFASKVDPAYTLPRDEMQREFRALADALTDYQKVTQ